LKLKLRMPTPLEIYNHAAQQSKTATTEVEFRAIAHQVYYATYHLACDTFGKDPTAKDEAEHGAIQALCKGAAGYSAQAPWRQALKMEYRTLKEHRVWADYNHDQPFAKPQHASVATAGASIFRRVQEYEDKKTAAAGTGSAEAN